VLDVEDVPAEELEGDRAPQEAAPRPLLPPLTPSWDPERWHIRGHRGGGVARDLVPVQYPRQLGNAFQGNLDICDGHHYAAGVYVYETTAINEDGRGAMRAGPCQTTSHQGRGENFMSHTGELTWKQVERWEIKGG
jgi:hypothetical protein